jgi:hypothetical protein
MLTHDLYDYLAQMIGLIIPDDLSESFDSILKTHDDFYDVQFVLSDSTIVVITINVNSDIPVLLQCGNLLSPAFIAAYSLFVEYCRLLSLVVKNLLTIGSNNAYWIVSVVGVNRVSHDSGILTQQTMKAYSNVTLN